MRVLLLLLLLTLVPGAATAQIREGMRCVQNQLAEAGFNPGPADGLVGASTRRALAEFQAETGLVMEHRFDTDLGNSLCRRIGLMRPELKAFWPSVQNRQPNIVFSDGVSKSLRARILLTVARAQTGIRNTFQIELAGRDVIVVADNPRDLRRLVAEHVKVHVVGQAAKIAEDCSSFRGISGRALPGLVYFCVPSEADRVADLDWVWGEFLFAHELVHLMQTQLGGASRVEWSLEKRLSRDGPAWLMEGIAQAYGNKFALGTPDWDYRIVNYRRLDRVFHDLAELESPNALKTRMPDVYRAGTVGAIDLVDLYGYPAIGRFYETLGHGLDWTHAFETAFGLTPQDFYHHYRNVVRFDAAGTPASGPLSTLVTP